ncbi:hypothetical protein GCM10027443_18160 [Pontibacter brevis]
METYLFTWNPDKWDWSDLEQGIKQLETIGYFERQWSCGNSKSIQKGDRIFLIRLGVEPKGIIGSGYAKSSYYKGQHWDGTEGKFTNYIDIEFDVLINPKYNDILPVDALEFIDPNGVQLWFPQQSGISIKSAIRDELETVWFNFFTENLYVKTSFISNDFQGQTVESYFEGKAKEVTQTRYERNPKARKVCLYHHGYSCVVCGFNFENEFGEIGKNFIHVHHLNPVSEIGQEYLLNPIEDLRPVCPNCHSMLHMKRPPFSIEEIMLKRKASNTSVT